MSRIFFRNILRRMNRFKFASSTSATAAAGVFESLKARTAAEMVRLRGVECTNAQNLSLLSTSLAVNYYRGVAVHLTDSSVLRALQN